jgi:CDP-6-deoxy-D-xylo-4-hexulose-3-dehydrase
VQTFVPDVNSVINAITPKTKAIFLANLAGSKPDWEAIRKRTTSPQGSTQILLIEDSCDTMTYTPITDITTTSFYASHIINALSSAGMVMFNNEKMYKRALCHRDWGRRAETNTEVMGDRFSHSIDGIFYDHKFLYDYVGYNMKSNEACAAFGLVQLEKLPTFLKRRRENMALYAKRLKAFFELPKDWELYDWIALPLLHKNRREIMEFLEANNVQTRVFFSGNITRHPAYRQYLQAFEGADRVMKEGFLIGCHHGMTLEDVNRVCDLLILYDMQHTQTLTQWIDERTITYKV